LGGVPLSPRGRDRRGTPSPAAAWAAAIVLGLWWAAGAAPAAPADEAAAQALVREGLKHLQAGNVERATRQFERAVQLAPGDPTVYIPLARAHGAGRRFAEAHKVLAKAEIHAHGERKILYEIELARGDLRRDEGDKQAARAAYGRAAGLRFFNREARERLQALDAAENAEEGSE
jgi:tetratricopeptide (TPR) repeat protein